MDIINWKQRLGEPQFNFCCVQDWLHYRIYYVYWEPHFIIQYESVMIFEGKYLYTINQYINNETEISVLPTEKEFSEKKTFKFNQKLFDFQSIDKDKLINKVKTILIFQ